MQSKGPRVIFVDQNTFSGGIPFAFFFGVPIPGGCFETKHMGPGPLNGVGIFTYKTGYTLLN